MAAEVRQRQMRFVNRSYVAFVFAPEAPVVEWLAQLDSWLSRTPDFFVGRGVVLDLTNLKLSRQGIGHLIGQLGERNIRIMGLEGADASQLGPDLPPPLRGGRPASSSLAIQSAPAPEAAAAAAAAASAASAAAAPQPKGPTSLLLEEPVRSGQSIIFPEGDVTVLGSVGSGAEIIAGGSIHVYGTLRGRALAGATGNPRARIFCHRIEAELLAIDGYYRTADEIDAQLHSRPVQAWLEGSTMMITALN